MKTKLFAVLLSLGFIISLGYPLLAAEEPASTIEVNIPEYEVEQMEGYDYVDIPGGDILLVDGKPRVPYYSVSLPYPKGYRVQDVTMTERSGLVTATGLNLTIVTMEPPFSLGSESSSSEQGGWYPEEDFNWRTQINSNGSSTLVIVMYPFYYNPETTDVKFYKNYRFDIEYIISSVTITSLTTAKDIHIPGDEVAVDIELNNSGETQDVVVSIVIKQYGSDKTVDGLPLRSLKNLVGDASLTAEWDSSGTDEGYYYAEVTLTDSAWNTLDKKTVGIPIAVSEVPAGPTPEKPTEFPILYVIIGAAVAVAVVASVFVIKSRKKA